MRVPSAPIGVFYSYAHKDESLRNELEKHLSILRRQGLISSWHDRQILAGTNWAETINTHLETATLILLLVSADFLASDYCYGIEMKRALERHKANEARVIPILLRPVEWKGAPFEHLQVLPTDARSVTEWESVDAAFRDIATDIRRAIEDLPQPSAPRTTLPSAWKIPYPRNPMFTGREEVLLRLYTQLRAGQATALSQAQAISGLGGIGKTQIAVEFAYQHRTAYETVLWVLADTRESLVSGYIAIAELLNLPEKDEQEQAVIIGATMRWLQTHDSWLLILDNADDLAMVREFIPPTFGGHLLLTTRAQSMGRLAKLIEVETMSQDVGALFLLRRAGLVTEKASLDTALPGDLAQARSICGELGGLPLALDQAGAYIEETQCSLQDYQKRYQMRRTQLLQRRGGLVADHPEGVSTTWSLSFEKVEKKSLMAADLLRVCAFLQPDAIPIELIMQGASHLGLTLAKVSKDEVALDEAIAILGAYSLVRRKREEKILSVHRLVQAVLKDTMDSETRHLWGGRAVLAVNEVFPRVEFARWSQCERYLPHALVFAELIEQEQISSPEAARLLYETGRYLIQHARISEASPLFQQTLVIYEQCLGSDHIDTARTVDQLARCFELQGNFSQAELLYRRALEVKEQHLGADHPSTATSLNHLALLYDSQGKYAEAEPLYRRALAIREQQLGADHPNTAQCLNNLAGLYRAQGKYAEAEPLYRRALAIREQQLGADHPDTAQYLNNLALLYWSQEKYRDAEELYKRALSIDERAYGLSHPDVATDLHNLAIFYERQSNYERAEPLFKRALLIREQALGLPHPDTQSTREWYVSLLRKLGRSGDADEVEAGGHLPS